LIVELQKIFRILNSVQKSIKLFLISIVIAIQVLFEVISLYSIYLIFNYLINTNANFNTNFFYNLLEAFNFFDFDENYYLQYLIIFVLIIYILKLLFAFLTFFLQFSFVETVRIDITKKVFNSYLNKNFEFHNETNISELLRNISTEIGNFCNGVAQQLLFLITELLLLIFIILFLFFFNSKIVIFSFLCIMPLFIIYSYLSRNYFIKFGQARHILFAKIFKSLIEPFQSIKELKIYSAIEYFVEKNILLNKKLSKVQIMLNLLNSTPRVIIEFIIVSILLAIIFFANSSGKINQENLSLAGIFAIAAIRMMPSMSKILNTTNLIKSNLPSVNVIFDELSKTINKKKILEDKLNFNTEIQVKNIDFKYKSSNKKLFSNFNASIKKNKVTGILGESGVGKSTFVNIVNGLIRPDNGKIFVDNIDINSNNNVYKWQKNISYVPQKIYLMDESIKNNIAFNLDEDQINEKLLIHSCKIAEIYEFIQKLPDKFETKIGELGSKISGGQIQRLGIARALYKNRELLILDEATNSLDEITEIKILNNLKNSSNKMTIILISHNRNTLNICDDYIDLSLK
jgi:ABC-type bacteriocin/lantibiotic exporter with double-glycine peptidase domain